MACNDEVKQRIYETLKAGYFNDDSDYVDVSNGSGADIEIVVVSRKFEGYNQWRRVDIILDELVKHLSPMEWGHVFLSIGVLPEEVRFL